MYRVVERERERKRGVDVDPSVPYGAASLIKPN